MNQSVRCVQNSSARSIANLLPRDDATVRLSAHKACLLLLCLGGCDCYCRQDGCSCAVDVVNDVRLLGRGDVVTLALHVIHKLASFNSSPHLVLLQLLCTHMCMQQRSDPCGASCDKPMANRMYWGHLILPYRPVLQMVSVSLSSHGRSGSNGQNLDGLPLLHCSLSSK